MRRSDVTMILTGLAIAALGLFIAKAAYAQSEKSWTVRMDNVAPKTDRPLKVKINGGVGSNSKSRYLSRGPRVMAKMDSNTSYTPHPSSPFFMDELTTDLSTRHFWFMPQLRQVVGSNLINSGGTSNTQDNNSGAIGGGLLGAVDTSKKAKFNTWVPKSMGGAAKAPLAPRGPRTQRPKSARGGIIKPIQGNGASLY